MIKWFICIGVAAMTQVTHMHNENSNIQERSPNMVKMILLLFKERTCSLFPILLTLKQAVNK